MTKERVNKMLRVIVTAAAVIVAALIIMMQPTIMIIDISGVLTLISLFVLLVFAVIDLNENQQGEKTDEIEPQKHRYLKVKNQEWRIKIIKWGNKIRKWGIFYRWTIVYVLVLSIIIYLGSLIIVMNARQRQIVPVDVPQTAEKVVEKPLLIVNEEPANKEPECEEPECRELPTWEEEVKKHIENGNVQTIDSLINTGANDEEAAQRHIRVAQLHEANSRSEEAEQHYQQAVNKKPSYESFSKIADFYYKMNKFDVAISYYGHCLYRATSTRDSAIVLTNMGNAQQQNNAYCAAEASYLVALTRYKILLDEDRDIWMPYYAKTSNLLGISYRYLNEYSKADKAYQEALKIRRELAKENQDACQDVIEILVNLAILYQNADPHNKELSLQYANKAKEEVGNCNLTPAIQEYINKVNRIIERWNYM